MSGGRDLDEKKYSASEDDISAVPIDDSAGDPVAQKILDLSTRFLVDMRKDLDAISDPQLRAWFVARLGAYGNKHAVEGKLCNSGIFRDAYFRENTIDDDKDYALSQIGLEICNPGSYSTQRSVLAVPSTKDFLMPGIIKTHQPKNMITVNGREYLKITPGTATHGADYRFTFQLLGKLGHSPTKDAQLAYFAANEDKALKTIERALGKMNPNLSTLDEKVPPPIVEELKASDLQQAILKKLETEIRKYPKTDSRHFFLDMIFQLTKNFHIPDFEKDPEKAEAIARAFRRLNFTLNHAIQNLQNNSRVFMTCIEHAYDNIKFLVSLTTPFDRDQLEQVHQKFIEEHWGRKPSAFSIVGSGMKALFNGIHMADTDLDPKKAKKNRSEIFIEEGAYYQFHELIEFLLDREIESLTFEKDIFINSKGKVLTHEGQSADILIASFEHNVSADKPGFKTNNVAELIEKQQRKANQQPGKKMVVVIDTTTGSYDDHNMENLLKQFSKEIDSGQIAIVAAQSLNKQFSRVDKTNAGIVYAFCNPEHFPHLANMPLLDGFLTADATPQMLTYEILHIKKSLFEFYEKQKINSRYVHENLIPESLFEPQPDKLLIVDRPYAGTKDENNWNFSVIRANPQLDLEKFSSVIDSINPQFHELYKKCHILYRDGYGFHTTTYSVILTPEADGSVNRLSIGNESFGSLKKKLQPVFHYVERVNYLFQAYVNGLAFNNDMGQLKLAISALTKRFMTWLDHPDPLKYPYSEAPEALLKSLLINELHASPSYASGQISYTLFQSANKAPEEAAAKNDDTFLPKETKETKSFRG